MSGRVSAAAGIALLLALAILLILVTAPSASSERARSADDFIDSIGVNTHTAYGDTAYGRFDLVRSRLRELGVRHVREGLDPRRDDQHRALNALSADGIKSTLILGSPGEAGSPDQFVSTASDALGDALAAVEGSNEHDGSGDPGWAEAVRTHQERLHELVESDPGLAGIPLIGPSVLRRENRSAIDDLDEYFDYGNMHSYPGGKPPAAGLASELEAAGKGGSRPVIATETGYHTAVRSATGHPPVSEEAAGIYTPRLYLEYFRQGVARTFLYELVDERPDLVDASRENNFGLLQNDFSPKPAYTALRNLIAILDDSAGEEDLDSLDYRLEGDTRDVRQLLLQKRDGDFYLALWQEVSVWDPDGRRALSSPARRVELRLAADSGGFDLYRPSRSSEPQDTAGGGRGLGLDVAADVTIVRIEPPEKSLLTRIGEALRGLLGLD